MAGCAAESDHHYFHKTEKPHAAEWGYEGSIGPSHWADLSPDYELAKTGHKQSPIDISSSDTSTLPRIVFDYRSAAVNLIYNGHTIEEKEDQHSSFTVAGKKYVLQQFHFHSPSEHTFDGQHADMEMHLVHKAADGEVAVIGVMINEGTENQAFSPVWNYLPTDANRTRKPSVTVDAMALLPSNHDYFRYMGSFTTPPCTEGVVWFMMRNPVEMSAGQIAKFRSIIQGNNRPVQALNGRTIQSSN